VKPCEQDKKLFLTRNDAINAVAQSALEGKAAEGTAALWTLAAFSHALRNAKGFGIRLVLRCLTTNALHTLNRILPERIPRARIATMQSHCTAGIYESLH
jgi:hypothetical protein